VIWINLVPVLRQVGNILGGAGDAVGGVLSGISAALSITLGLGG